MSLYNKNISYLKLIYSARGLSKVATASEMMVRILISVLKHMASHGVHSLASSLRPLPSALVALQVVKRAAVVWDVEEASVRATRLAAPSSEVSVVVSRMSMLRVLRRRLPWITQDIDIQFSSRT